MTQAAAPQAPSPDALLRRAMGTSEGRADPLPLLGRLHQDDGELCWMSEEGYLAVFGYASCDRVMRSPEFGRQPPGSARSRIVWPSALTAEQEAQLRVADARGLGQWLQLVDPPDHTRLRRLVSQAFTPQRVARLRPVIEATVDRLLIDVAERQTVDLVADVARPMPRAVIGELIGLPVADRDWFAGHAAAQRHDKDPNAGFEDLLAAARGRRAIAEYLSDLLEERRRQPQDDLVSGLLAAEDAGERLDHAELLALVSMLYIAAYGTTADFVANTVTTLLQHPDQLQVLRAEPALVRQANEEALRYLPVLLSLDYWSKRDTELAGTPVAGDTPMHVFIGAANRDPRVFSDPERFDVRRTGPTSLSFGAGAHYCLGAPLARLQGEVAIGRLLERFEVWELTEPEPELMGYFNYRSYRSVHVRLTR
jgi:unspecific monooxygenase